MVPFRFPVRSAEERWCPPYAFCIIPAMVCHIRLGLYLLIAAIIGAADTQTPARAAAPSGHVGAAMTLLATLQEADVLPPEGTPEANRVIKIVIQFQSVFMKSTDPAVQDFFHQALARQWGTRAEALVAGFRTEGWTSEVLVAISEHYALASGNERDRLAEGFSRFNVTLADFSLLTELFENARVRFSQRGQDIHQVFAEQRRAMPGRKSS
jgi:hypothetical protein